MRGLFYLSKQKPYRLFLLGTKKSVDKHAYTQYISNNTKRGGAMDTSTARLFKSDIKDAKKEAERLNRESMGPKEDIKSIVHEGLRHVIRCRECGNVRYHCSCNNTDK
jgi:hypothetical protein